MKSEASAYQAIRRFWKQSIQQSQREFSEMEMVVRRSKKVRIPISRAQVNDMENLVNKISYNYRMLDVFRADDKEQEEIEQERIRKEKDSYD